MKTTTKILQMLVRVFGVIQLALGLAVWTGNLINLVTIHILIGIVLVVSLWSLAVIGALNGTPASQVVVAVVWGLIGALLGLTQNRILPDQLHWIVQIVHLLVGVGIIGQAEGLARRIKERTTTMVLQQ